jgi:hypothetical protein
MQPLVDLAALGAEPEDVDRGHEAALDQPLGALARPVDLVAHVEECR